MVRSRPYFVLLQRDPDGVWSPQFGDYVRSVVDEERSEYTRSAMLLPRGSRPTYQVVRVHTDRQQATRDLVARMNTRNQRESTQP